MATYTESTGFNVLNFDTTAAYDAWQTAYTCPVGKFAVVQQMQIRTDSGGGITFLRFNKLGNGNSATLIPNSDGHNLSSANSFDQHTFTFLATYSGVSHSVAGNKFTNATGYEGERFLTEGESIQWKHQRFGSTGRCRVRIEEYTAQV